MLELSVDEARHLDHNYIGTEHLLLGLLDEHKGLSAQVLAGLSVGGNQLRQRIEQTLNDSGNSS